MRPPRPLTALSWMVTDTIIRTRERYGRFGGDEYYLLASLLGLTIETRRLPVKLPAIVCDSTIVLSDRLSSTAQAWYAWHEVGHFLMHEGDRRALRSHPEGRAMMGKYERQADEFADRFPDWTDV